MCMLEDGFKSIHFTKDVVLAIAITVTASMKDGTIIPRETKRNKDALLHWLADREDYVRDFLPSMVLEYPDGRRIGCN